MRIDDVLQRIQGEYVEMPGLRLTPAQAQRLWGLERDVCFLGVSKNANQFKIPEIFEMTLDHILGQFFIFYNNALDQAARDLMMRETVNEFLFRMTSRV